MAKTVKGIIIEIEGKTSGLVKSLADVDKQLKNTQDALKQVDQALKLDPNNVELLSSKQKLLTDAIEDTKKKLDIEREAADKAKDALMLGTITEQDYATLISNVSKTASELDKMEGEASNTAQAIKDIDAGKIKDVGSAAQDSKEKMMALKDATKLLKEGLIKASKAAQSFLKSGMQSAIDYETALTGVMKTVDETATTSYDDISDAIKNMAAETGVSKTEIAGVAEAAGQLGISADDLVDFTKTMIDMGVSTNISAQDAASALAKMFNVLDEDMGNVQKAGSTIVALGNNFATTENDIVSMATRLAATGAVVGLSTDQILAISTALSSVGIEAEAGGSAISKLLKKMDVSVSTYKKSNSIIGKTGMSLRELELMQSLDSKGFKGMAESLGLTTKELGTAISNVKSLNQYAEVSGMTAEQFATAYGQNAVGALGSFINGLSAMDGTGQSATAMLQEMGLTEVRLSNAVLALATSDDILTQATDMASDAWDTNRALTDEAGKRYDTTAQQIKGAQEQFDNLKIELMETLMPVLQDLIKVVKDIVEWFSNLDDDTKENIAKFIALTAILGPLITTIGSVIGVVKTLGAVFGAMGFGGVLSSLVATGGPIALAVAGIAGLGATVVTVIKDMKELRELREQAERMTANVEAYKQSTKDKMINNPYKGLAADVNSDEYKKAVAAYKLMGLNPDDYRQRAIEIVNNQTLELDGAVVAQSTSRQQANTNYKLNGGYA